MFQKMYVSMIRWKDREARTQLNDFSLTEPTQWVPPPPFPQMAETKELIYF
jgi:hypothetical protein